MRIYPAAARAVPVDAPPAAAAVDRLLPLEVAGEGGEGGEGDARKALLTEAAAATVAKATGFHIQGGSMTAMGGAEEAVRAWVGTNYLRRTLGAPANQTVRGK
eukprot:1181562-Prorocentrum_minimum.AAC.3